MAKKTIPFNQKGMKSMKRLRDNEPVLYEITATYREVVPQ